MTEISNFLKTVENRELGWLEVRKPNKRLGRTRCHNGNKKFFLTTKVLKAIANKSPKIKNLNDADLKTVDILLKTPTYNRYRFFLAQEKQQVSNFIKNYLFKTCKC